MGQPRENPVDDAARRLAQAADEIEQRAREIPTVAHAGASPPPMPDFPDIRRPDAPDRVLTGRMSGKETRETMRLWALAINFVAGVVGGVLVGWLIDRWRGTSPWGVLIGAGVGLVGGSWGLIREALRSGNTPAKPGRPGR